MLIKIRNWILFRVYKKEIIQLLSYFYDSLDKGKKFIEAEQMNAIVKSLGWSPNKARRVHFLCIYFGFLKECNHPYFKRRICYSLTNNVK